MDYNSNLQPNPTGMISHALITGGRFNQYNHHNKYIQIQGVKTGFDCLQEAVAPGAFHNSAARFDPPKCHPNTRVAVMDKIMDWILRQDPETRDALIMWLHGAAGAGKSAIAQSIAEHCYTKGLLIASFFFGRSDPSRNHAGGLFATIAYQMAMILPQVREIVVATIEYDPLIFTRSLSTQFLHLIVEPLRYTFRSEVFRGPCSPRLIVIDGLDECLDRKQQCDILDIIHNGIRRYNLPLIFLIASRPDHDISTKFASPEMSSVLTRLILDDTYLPDEDIELYLGDQLAKIKESHPFKGCIPTVWPTKYDIWKLVENSSGQFIYASTVIKYVESNRHRPHHRLEDVLHLRATRGELPFAELDALYTHIFSSVNEIGQVLDVLSFCMFGAFTIAYVEEIEKVLSLEPGDIQLFFCDLGSIVTIVASTSTTSDLTKLAILHASLSDFLLDESRSNQFHIDMESKCTKHVGTCLRFLTYGPLADSDAAPTAMEFVCSNFKHCKQSAQLQDDIFNFSLNRVYIELESNFAVFQYLPDFFSALQSSKFDNANHLYTHHLQSFDDVMRSRLEVYYPDTRLTLLLALVVFVQEKYEKSQNTDFLELSFPFQLFDADEFWTSRDEELCVLEITLDQAVLISDFLTDPVRSGEYALDGDKYATAALCCLIYLCDHLSPPQILPPRYTTRTNKIRRNSSWMWLRRMGKYGALDKSRIWRKKQGDIVYRRKIEDVGLIRGMRNPIVAERVWSQKYCFGLQYLAYFLPRSAKSEELIQFARRHTFASRSQEFPNHCKKARKAINAYLERTEPRKMVVRRG